MCNCSGFQFCGECARSSECTAAIPGLNGLDGKTVLSGTTDPSNTLGSDGDFYIRRQSPFRFFYKSAGVWSYLGDLKGVDGNGFLVEKSETILPGAVWTLFSNPVQILPALSFGYVYSIVEAIGVMVQTGSAYTAPSDWIYLRYNGAVLSDTICGWQNLLTSSTRLIKAGNFAVSASYKMYEGAAVEIYKSAANPGGIGGSLTFKVSYHIWTV